MTESRLSTAAPGRSSAPGRGPGLGWVTFAGVMLLLVGAFNVVVGLVALYRSDLFVAAPSGLLVFIASLGFFIVPALLGGRHEAMIGQVIIEQIQQVPAKPAERDRRQAGAVPVQRDGQQEPALYQLSLQSIQPVLSRQRSPDPLPHGSSYRWGETGRGHQPLAAQQHRGERIRHRPSPGLTGQRLCAGDLRCRTLGARGGERTRYMAW